MENNFWDRIDCMLSKCNSPLVDSLSTVVIAHIECYLEDESISGKDKTQLRKVYIELTGCSWQPWYSHE